MDNPISDEKNPLNELNKDLQNGSNSNKPDAISINFSPKIPGGVETSATDKIEKPVNNLTPLSDKQTPIISLNLTKDDLNKAVDIQEENKDEKSHKQGFFSSLFSKKANDNTKPSSAWDGALDVKSEKKDEKEQTADNQVEIKNNKTTLPNNTGIKPLKKGEDLPVLKLNNEKDKVDFFASASLKEKAGTSKLMENITSQKSQLEQPNIEDLLGKKSKILEKSIEQESILNLKKKLRFAQAMTAFILLLMVGVNSFLYYELSPGMDIIGYIHYNFDSNLRNDLFNLNQSLKSVQTELNKYNVLSGQLYLDQFGYESTKFLDGINQLETPGLASNKNIVQSLVSESKINMPIMLEGAKNHLSKNITIETYTTRGEEKPDELTTQSEFQNMLKEAISKEKKDFIESNSQSDLAIPNTSLVFFDNAYNLVGNTKFLNSLKSRTVDAFKIDADDYENNKDIVEREKFQKFINDLLASTKVNFAIITNLKNERIEWTNVIDRLEQIANKVNNDHNTGLHLYNNSVIEFNNFDLNSHSGHISINGSNTTNSGTNREVITYLIEALESSIEFKNVSNRNFPLSKSVNATGQETYTMNFKIDLDIENGAFSKSNKPIADLSSKPKVAVKK